MFTIFTNGDISHNGVFTGFAMSQGQERTIVRNTKTGEELTMPHQRYALSCDKPASGNPGRAAFFAVFALAIQASSTKDAIERLVLDGYSADDIKAALEDGDALRYMGLTDEDQADIEDWHAAL